MDTTDEHWSVDGVSLQTLAWNVSTWGGSPQGAPPMRGDDILIPHRAGRVWVPKHPASRTLEFRGWVVGADRHGEGSSSRLFRQNWRALRSLLVTPRKEVSLTRRWRDSDSDGVVALRSATGRGQVLDGMEPQSTGPSRAQWSADVFMADPCFYGQPVETVVQAGYSTTITVEGDYWAGAVEVEFTAPLSNAVLTATHDDLETWVGYSALSTGTAVLDVGEFTALEGATPRLDKITHGGAFPWLVLPPGQVTLSLAATGAGSVKVTHTPVWW